MRHMADPEKFFRSSLMLVSWLAVYALAVLVWWIAACTGRKGEAVREFRRGVWGSTMAGWLAGLMGWVLAMGLSGAMLAMGALFGWPKGNMEIRLAWTIWLVAGLVVAPALGYARLPRGQDEEWPPVPSWTTWLARWGLVPVVGVYALILAVYLGRLAICLEWPTGMLAWPVLSFEILGWAAWGWLRGERGERDAAEPVPSRILLRAMPWAGAALAAVLALAVSVRTEAYGTTVLRAAGYWAAAWFMVVGVLYAVRPRARTRAAAVLACIAAVLAAWGPLSVRNVAIRSQLARLRDGMSPVLVAVRNGAPLPVEVEGSKWQQARDAADYLKIWFASDEIDFPEGETVRAALAEADSSVQIPEDARPWDVLFLAGVRPSPENGTATGGETSVDDVEIFTNPARVRTERAETSIAGWERLWWTSDACAGEPWDGMPWRLDPARGPVSVADGTPLAVEEWRAFGEKVRDLAYGATAEGKRDMPTGIVSGEELAFTFAADGWEYQVQFRTVRFDNGEIATTYAGFVLGRGIRSGDGVVGENSP